MNDCSECKHRMNCGTGRFICKTKDGWDVDWFNKQDTLGILPRIQKKSIDFEEGEAYYPNGYFCIVDGEIWPEKERIGR